MSTVAVWSGQTLAPATAAKAKPSFFERLLRAREKEAAQRIQQFVASLSDEHLLGLGYSPEDIRRLRKG